MKTAMQELIELIETFMVVNDDIPDYYEGLIKSRDLANSLLQKEREQIEQAFTSGQDSNYFDDPSDYFTQTYNTPKP